MAVNQNASQDKNDPGSTSSDYRLMESTWRKTDDILAGLDAVRAAGVAYLPKYEKESEREYHLRLMSTAWRPEFEDGIRNLSAKPFNKDVALEDGAPDQIKVFAEDVDGQGNNLTQFARPFFESALANGLAGLLVDYPMMAPNLTLADEQAANAKPYWCMVGARSIVAAYFDTFGGETYLSHLRLRENYIKRDGEYGETEVERVRVFNRTIGAGGKGVVTWELWESVENQNPSPSEKKYSLQKKDEGTISLDKIPFVFFFTGKRFSNYAVKPPLNSLADMQLELYRALSRKEEILTFAGAPMLKMIGVTLDGAETTDNNDGKKQPAVTVGARSIITIPPGPDGSQGDADFIQPAAQNITAIFDDINDTIENMRRLAMQPITDKAGNPTATGQAIDQAKAHSTLQSWALGLKDALELAFVYTAQWMGLQGVEPEVQVFTDWGVDADGVNELTLMQKDVMAGNLSRRTYWNECKRRDVLSQDFDADQEEEDIKEEALNAPDQNIDPLAGRTVRQQQEAA